MLPVTELHNSTGSGEPSGGKGPFIRTHLFAQIDCKLITHSVCICYYNRSSLVKVIIWGKRTNYPWLY